MMKIFFAMIVAAIGGMALGARFFGASVEKADSPFVSFTNCSAEGAEQIFTCGMHPQVQTGQPGHCPACGMRMVESRLLPFNNPSLVSLAQGELLLANVRTQKVGHQDVEVQELRLNGRVAPDESRVYEQLSYLPGRIEQLYVNKTGMQVRKGQPIASVYSKDLISVVEAFAYSRNTESIIRAAQNNLKSWKLDESILRQFDLNGDYRKPVDIRSDYNGTVLEMKVGEGAALANVHIGQPTALYKLADLSRLWVILEAYEAELPWIREGDPVYFTTSAYPGRRFCSKVDFINPVVDPVSRIVQVRLEVNNEEGLLKPDMYVRAWLAGKQEGGQQISVPKTAVLWTGKRSVVYVRDPAYDVPAFRCREVVLGESLAGEAYAIVEGLEEGEEIVVSGALALDAEAQLSGKKSMMNLDVQ